MSYRITIATFLAVISLKTCHASINLFNTQALEQHTDIHQFLLHEGFAPCLITTPDNHQLNGLILHRPQTEATLIVCGGLCCLKESMATFYALAPKTCNVLLFDARGHGSSSGSLWQSPWRYGMYEYNDIIGCLNFVSERTNKLPIIVYGNCAGGFNAAHALLKLNAIHQLEHYNVQGFIFDSGWGSVIQASRTSFQAKLQKSIKKLSMHYLGSSLTQSLSNSILLRLMTHGMNGVISLSHFLVIRPLLWLYEKETNLYDKIVHLKIPTLFIHSLDDTWVAFKNVKKLAQLMGKKYIWWITQPSQHSCHHIIHHDNYQKVLHTFCNKVLVNPTNSIAHIS